MQIAEDSKNRNLISLTPLIDVVFILLVFFMLVTDFAKFSIVTLSVAQTETVTAVTQTSSVVRISASGELHFDDQQIKFSELAGLVNHKLTTNPRHVFFIHPADDTLLQDTVFVLDELVPLAPDNISFLHDLTGQPQ